MGELNKLLDIMRKGNYDPQYNNHHYLSYEVDNAIDNVQKLAKTLENENTYKQGLRFAKMGLYLSIFEDSNSKIFFDKARSILSELNTDKSEKLRNYLVSYDIETPIDLEGQKVDSNFKVFWGGKWRKENFDRALKDFNKLRKDAWRNLFNKRQFFSQDMEECLKSTLSSLNKKQERFEYELTELKDDYQIKKNKLQKRLDKHKRSIKRKIKEKFLHNYQKNELLKLAKMSSEELKKVPEEKKELVKKLQSHYKNIKEDIEQAESETRKKIITEMENNEKEYKQKVQSIKSDYKDSMDMRQEFFDEIRGDKLASYFGKDFIKIFGVYGSNFDTDKLWEKFIDLEYLNKGIQESYNRLVAKLKRKIDEFQDRYNDFIAQIGQQLEKIK